MVFVFIILLVAGDAQYLVLNNGKKLLLDEGYKVKNGKVLFKSRTGQPLQVSVDLIDLEASEKETRKYHQSLVKTEAPKKVRPNYNGYPDDLFEDESRIHKNMIETRSQPRDRVRDFSTRSYGKDDFYGTREAWKTYAKGLKVMREKKNMDKREKKLLHDQLRVLSNTINECRRHEYKKDDMGGTEWTENQASLKIKLKEVHTETEALVRIYEK